MTTRQASPPPAGAALGDPAERGFSMIEGLIATALIGLVAIGLIPMFTRALSDNMAGSDYTRVSNYAKSDVEDFAREPFSNMTTQVGTGLTTGQKLEYYNPLTSQWVVGSPPAGNANIVWTRTTTYSQYGLNDDTTDSTYDQPVSGGSTPDAVQLIQAQVQIKAISPVGPEGAHRTTIIRFLKGF